MAVAFMCGAGFVVHKTFEYSAKIHAGIVINSNDFVEYYYMLTGIHLVHVIIGQVVPGVLTKQVTMQKSQVPPGSTLESAAMFWHMVDLLWIALFYLLYLLP